MHLDNLMHAAAREAWSRTGRAGRWRGLALAAFLLLLQAHGVRSQGERAGTLCRFSAPRAPTQSSSGPLQASVWQGGPRTCTVPAAAAALKHGAAVFEPWNVPSVAVLC